MPKLGWLLNLIRDYTDTMMATVIFPILNKKFISFKGPQWYINDNILVRTLNDEDFGAIARYDNQFLNNNIKSGQKCVYWDCAEADLNNKNVEIKVSAIKFAINTFLEKDSLFIPFCIVITKKRISTVTDIVHFPYYGGVSGIGVGEAKLRADTQPILVQETFKLANVGLAKNPACLLMVKRYNMSLLRTDPLDRLIDTAIALEHIISERTELTFRLCLVISFCVESDPKNRNKVFNMFKKFYEARSSIVHGVSDIDDKKIKIAIKSLDEIRKYGAVAMVYYFKFLEENDPKKWKEHCMDRIIHLEDSVLA